MEEPETLALLLDGSKPDIFEVYAKNTMLLKNITKEEVDEEYDLSEFSEFKTEYTQIWIKEKNVTKYYGDLNNVVIFHNNNLLLYLNRKSGEIMECYRWNPLKFLSKNFINNMKLIDNL